MKYVLPLLAAILLAACATTPSGPPPPKFTLQQVTEAIQLAQAAIKKSSAAGNEWRDASKLLGQAKMAAENGEYDDAMRYAELARQQGELAYQQAQDQKLAKPWLF
ncbi:MAG: DUF4398 domain-containing protein [Gammaproteobacteria bacterium]|nr:DUF4398 domain-containing protein [Gammaproteobacteria bacterium]